MLGPIVNVISACLVSSIGLSLQSCTLRTENPAATDQKRRTNARWVFGFACSLLSFAITADAMRFLSPSTVAILSPATLLFLFVLQHLGIVESPDAPPSKRILGWSAVATVSSVVVALVSATWTQVAITAESACELPMVIWGTAIIQYLIVDMFDAPSLPSLSLLLAISSSAVTLSLGNAIAQSQLTFIPIVIIVAGTASCVVLFQTIMHLYPLQVSISLHFPMTQLTTFVSGLVLCVTWSSITVATGVVAGLFACLSVGASAMVIELNQRSAEIKQVSLNEQVDKSGEGCDVAANSSSSK